jgi:hypothetical protein
VRARPGFRFLSQGTTYNGGGPESVTYGPFTGFLANQFVAEMGKPHECVRLVAIVSTTALQAVGLSQHGRPFVADAVSAPGSPLWLDKLVDIPSPAAPLLLTFTASAAGGLSFLFEVPECASCP